jgi:hypothetical protein
MKTMSSPHRMKWAVSTFVGIANAILPQHCRERTPGERRQQRAVLPLVFSTRSSRPMRTSGEIMFHSPSALKTLLTTGLSMIMLH